MIANHPDIELVGGLVYHDEKVGRDVGELAGLGPLGVRATNRVEDLLDLDADVFLFNPPNSSFDVPIAMLAAGMNVITAAGSSDARNGPMARELEAACEAGQSSFMGSGINPGFAPDVLPMVASSLCGRVDSVHVYAGGNVKYLDAAMLTLMGFGAEVGAQQENSVFLQYVVGSYEETARFLARCVSLPIDNLVIEPEFEPALQDIDAKLVVKKGQTAGIRLSLIGMVGERRVSILENTWFMGRQNVRESWLGKARDSGWTVQIAGDPDVELNVDVSIPEDASEGGSRTTAARMFNSIPAVCAAPPGVLNFLDLPIPRVWQ